MTGDNVTLLNKYFFVFLSMAASEPSDSGPTQTDSVYLSQTAYAGLLPEETWSVLYSDDYDKYYTGVCKVGRAETLNSEFYELPAENELETPKIVQKRHLRMFPDVGLLRPIIDLAKRYYFKDSEICFETEQIKKMFVDDYEVVACIDGNERLFKFDGFHLQFVNTVGIQSLKHLRIDGNIWICFATNEEIKKYQSTEAWIKIKSQFPLGHEIKNEHFFTMITQIDITSAFRKVFGLWSFHSLFVSSVKSSTTDVFSKMINNIFEYSKTHQVEAFDPEKHEISKTAVSIEEDASKLEDNEIQSIDVDNVSELTNFMGPAVYVPASTFNKLFD